MTVPKKPLTKNESAIQLGNILKGGPRGGGSKKSVIKKIKKLLKIGEKPSKNSNPIKEVKMSKKSLQKQQKVATKEATKQRKKYEKLSKVKQGLKPQTKRNIEKAAILTTATAAGVAGAAAHNYIRKQKNE